MRHALFVLGAVVVASALAFMAVLALVNGYP